jgi:hypothetical protein
MYQSFFSNEEKVQLIVQIRKWNPWNSIHKIIMTFTQN